jgi:hypothetical protein
MATSHVGTWGNSPPFMALSFPHAEFEIIAKYSKDYRALLFP